MAQQRAAKDLVITCIKGEGKLLKFWALPLPALDTVKNLESHFANRVPEFESSCGFSRSEQIPVGSKCVVKSKIKHLKWCRARVLAHQGLVNVLVQLLDYGNEELIYVSDIRTIDERTMSIPAQAIECALADVLPIRSEWSIEAIKFCEQHLLYNTLSCYVVSEYMNLPIVRVAKKGESEAFVQRLINGGMALIKRESTSSPTPVPTLAYKMNSMDPNSTHLVKVSCVENAHKFYVQLSAAEMELKHLMDTINRLPKESHGPMKVPTVHSPCLAQLSTKPCFYRALITGMQQTRCKVFFVDYGFSELKEVHELKAIHPTFLQLSAQAICCALPPDTNIDTEEFKHLIGFEHLELHVLNRTPEVYIVRLLRRGMDLLQAPQEYVQQKLAPGTKYEVTVSYVNDVAEFYCQLTQLKEQQTIISNVLNSGYKFAPISLGECTPGKPVCVNFPEDNLWYRAQILNANHENDIEVFFVDFGNCDNVGLGAIRKIGSDLLNFPIQAFKCFLHDTPIPNDPRARDDAFDLLEELTTDQCLLAQVNTSNESVGYGITLYMKNSPVSINEKLLSKFLSIPAAQINDVENVYVTSFDSPSSFFAQFEKLDSEDLAQMQEEINVFYASSKNTTFVPQEGNFVCARFNVDDQFYRARVEKCRTGSCDVYFIDYGNRESIPIEDVHNMNPKFMTYPQFGTECALENFPPQIPCDKLSVLMLENSFQLRMIRKDNEKWLVSLVENFQGNVPVLDLIRQSEAPVPRSIHGTGLGGYQEKFSKTQAPHTNSWSEENRRASPPANRNEKSYNNVECSRESPRQLKPEEPLEYKSLSIPTNAYRNVYVSHVISPSEFFCQIEEDSHILQRLMKTIEDVYTTNTNNLNMTNFVKDAACCAMYNDGAWYRGKINKVGSSTCDVFFVDYGNTDPVSKSNIKMLRNDLFSCPIQAFHCKSFNVSPKGSDWSDSEIVAFIKMTMDKSFVAQFVEHDSRGVYSVNLVSIGKLEHDIFNKEFVNLGYGRLQDSSKSLVLNSHAASANLSFSFPNIAVGSSEAVQVTFGLNPGEIFCQLKSSEKEFRQMMMNLQSYYNSVSEAESLIDRPHQGMICAAQFFLDSAWYRAEIRKVEANKIYVFYVDYGNTETVDRKKIRCIIQEYTTLPVQAVKCRIRGIKPPGKSWPVNNSLSKYFEGDSVCKFISKENDYFIVDITCNRKDIAQTLISDRLAISDMPTTQSEVSPKTSPAIAPKFDKAQVTQSATVEESLPERKDAFVPGQLLSVVVSFVENPSKFWCQLLDESDALDQLIADIEDQVLESPPVNSASLKIGSYCIAQYHEDEAWYRAKIQSCEPGNTYKVFFIDYGNTEAVSLDQMKTMLPKLMEQSPLCFECCLQGTPSKLLPEMTPLFRDTVTDIEEITAKVEHVTSGVCTLTLLIEQDDQEVNVSELLFGAIEPCVESSDVSGEIPHFLPPDVPLGLHEGYVSVVNSPQDFYIQLAGTEDALADLSEELAELSESSSAVNVSQLCVGYACSTLFSEDNSWYRAEVVSLQDSTASVVFVDYGNIDTVEKSLLKSLSEKHLSMPPQAIKCKLNGIVPVSVEWSEEAINTFQTMVLEEPLGVTFISKDIPATVNITKEDKDIAQCLVDMELANFEACTETDEAYVEDHLAPAPVEDPLSSLPSDQSYPERKLSSTKHAVKICYVDSYDKFYVTPLELSTELDTVMNTLEILYKSADEEANKTKSDVPLTLEETRLWMPCVAKYSEDGDWYRALITEIDGDNIYVKFVDYGNSEITTLSNLRPLTPELVKIPPIALECSLYGIEAIPGKEQEISGKLENYFVEEMELEMEICEFAPYKIKLSLKDDDISSMLITEGLAKEQPVQNENEVFVENSKMAFADGSLEFKIQISKRFFNDVDKINGNVKFCEIENDLIVFHVVSTDLEDGLNDLQQKLQDAYCAPKNLTNIACMDFCATKYVEDENWYRAQVLSFDKDKVKVRFIDYGNCETVDRSDIYELLGDFTVEPQFSVKCVLFGLKVDKSKEVELQNRLDEYVYHDAVELILCKHSHAVQDLCITSVVCGDIDITEVISHEMLVSQQYVINSNLDTRFKAIVQKIESNTVFLLPLNTVDVREAFQCKLQNMCKDSDTVSVLKPGQLYAAEVDNTWYRVSVINASSSEVTVDLVDFGITKVAITSEFVPLPLDICHQPIFLQPCVVEVFDDPTGNVKMYSVDNLSVGKEVLCELQNKCPIVHPVSVRILEVGQNMEENEKLNDDASEVNEVAKVESEDVGNFSGEAVHTEQSNFNEEEEHFPSQQDDVNNELNDVENILKDEENDHEKNELGKTESEDVGNFSGEVVHTEQSNFNEEEEHFPSQQDNVNHELNDVENIVKDEENMNEEIDHEKNELGKMESEDAGNYSDDFRNVEQGDIEKEEQLPSQKDIDGEIKSEGDNIEENPIISEEFEENDESPSLQDGEIDQKINEKNIEEIKMEKNLGDSYQEEKNISEDQCVEETEENSQYTIENSQKSDVNEPLIANEKFAEYDADKKSTEKNYEEIDVSNGNDAITKIEFDSPKDPENLNDENSNNPVEPTNETQLNVSDSYASDAGTENALKEELEKSEGYEFPDAIDNFESIKENLTTECYFDETDMDNNDLNTSLSEKDLCDEKTDTNSEIHNDENSNLTIDSMKNEAVTSCVDALNDKNNIEFTQPGIDYEESVTKEADIYTEDKDASAALNEECSVQDCTSFYSDASFDDKNLDETLPIESVNRNFDETLAGDHDDKTKEEEIVKNNNEQSDIKYDNLCENMDLDSEIGTQEVEIFESDASEINEDPAVTDIPEDSFEDGAGENNRGIEECYQLSGSAPVKVSHIAISDGSVIFAVQPSHLQEEFLLLKQSMQEFYSTKALPYDDSSKDNYCIVYHEGEWCRGKILQSGHSTILLIDYGKCTSVDSSDIKKLDAEHTNVPPFAVWCMLSSAICPPEKSETARTFLCDKLMNVDATVKILEGGEPYKVNIFLDGSSILNQLLKNSLVTQKLPNMYLEPGSYKAKLSFLNINLNTVEIFINLSTYCSDKDALFDAMQDTYKVEECVSNIVDSGIYAAFVNDSWYRGLVVSSGNEIQVHLVDTGETVTDCEKLCFLLPEHCFQPAFAIPCHIPLTDIQATNEISESVNNVLKAVEFLVDIEICADSNSLSATLIDEQIVSEVKNIKKAYATTDMESSAVKSADNSKTENVDSAHVKREDSVQISNFVSDDLKLSSKDSCSPANEIPEQKSSDQIVGYLEESFSTEPS